MRVNFLHRHVLNTMAIMEKGNLPHPRCSQYHMLVPWWALNDRQPTASQCARRA